MQVCYEILLLLCFAAAHGSVRDISKQVVTDGLVSREGVPDGLVSREVVTDGLVQKPRLIVNPFGVFGNAPCNDEGDEGRCNGLIECVALAGDVKTFCPGLQGPCCVFYRTCNQRTAQEVSYFRNAKWPEEEKALDNCAFKVIRRSDLFCGLRVQAEQGHLPTKSGTCGNAYVHIVGAGNRSPLPLCGRSSGIDYSLDFRHVDTVTINVNSTSRTTMGWNIKLSQIPCTEFGGETGSTTGGDGGGPISIGGGSTGVSGGGSTGVSGGDNACGVKGRSTIKRTRDAAASSREGGFRNSSSKSWFTRPGVQGPPANRRNKTPDIDADNPFIRDLEFLGPDVNDSVFHYFKGEDSLLTTRVTYGSDTSPNEYPWQVAMFLGSRYHCGASVIGDWFILTAAHCVESYKSRPSSLKLSIGDWDLSNKNDGPYVEAQVAAIRVHPKYARTNLQNDLAVLKLTAKLDYSERIRPVCLPTTDIPTDGEQATITGWGRDENQRLKTTLQELTADITTNALCNKRWQSNNAASDFIVATMMCMDASNGDSCNGDSGGPSVMEYPRGSGKYVQVGIVSFGSGSCTDTNLPGVYTRVSKYRDWIRQQMF